MSILKQIIKWFSGGFFRRLGSIFAFMVIAMLLALIFAKNDIKIPFIGFEYINAATIPTSSDQWASQWCSDRNCDYTQDGSTYFRSYENVNSGAYSNSNHYYLTAIRLRLQFSSSNYLQAGTQYQIRFKLWFSPQYPLNYYSFTQENIDFTITDSSNATTTLDNSNFTCSYSDISGNDSFFLTCFYTPTSQIKQVYLRIKYPYMIYSDQSGYSGYIYKSLTSINYTSSLVSYNSGTQDAIQNQTTTIIDSTTNIINNNNQNTQDIINNQNANSQAQIESQQVCNIIDKNSIVNLNHYIDINGNIVSNEYNWGLTDYIKVSSKDTLTPFITGGGSSPSLCFYTENKVKISCIANSSFVVDTSLIIPSNTSFVRISIQASNNYPQFNLCKNGNQALTDTLTDDNVSSDVNDMGDFLTNFSSNEDSAISSIITLPLTFISTLFEDTTCPNLSFTLKGVTSTLPCGDIIWGKTTANSIFGVVSISTFKTFFNLVVGGFLCYKLLMGIVHTYETAIDPLESGLGRKGVMKL